MVDALALRPSAGDANRPQYGLEGRLDQFLRLPHHVPVRLLLHEHIEDTVALGR